VSAITVSTARLRAVGLVKRYTSHYQWEYPRDTRDTPSDDGHGAASGEPDDSDTVTDDGVPTGAGADGGGDTDHESGGGSVPDG